MASLSANEPVPVLYLAGIGRSGTTLVERTLGETPGITALGEVMHLWERGLIRNELCACGTRFLECPFWTKVGDNAFGGWSRVDPHRMLDLKSRVDRASRVPVIALGRPSRLREAADEYLDHYVRLYGAVHKIVGGTLVDSSKQVSLAWCLSQSELIDLRVVHCLRDSRGVAHSWAKETARPEAVDEEFRLMPRYSPGSISALWLLHNTEIELLGSRVPVQRLRYEDFVSDPAAATRRILHLADVTAEPAHIEGTTVALGMQHSCAGNPMRFRRGSIDVITDERWRREQQARDRRVVSLITAPLLARYGYPL